MSHATRGLTALTATLLPIALAGAAGFDDRLTGDWGGSRTQLKEQGYDFFAYYNAIVSSNVSGGLDSGSAYAGDLFAGMTFDLGKILGADGWTFNLSGIDRHGASIDDDVGGIYSVMQLVGGQTWFLYNLSLEKRWDAGQHALKFGRITATDDFAGSPFYGYYLSNSIDGQIRAVLFDGVMTSYPFAVWGARYKYAPSDDFRARIGVYQLTERMWDPDLHGTDFTFRDEDGVSVMAQLEWDWRAGTRPGHFAVGLNNVSFEMPNFNSDDTTDSFIRYYAQIDQQVTQEREGSDQGLYLFGTLAYTNQQEPALVPFQTSLGAQYVGPIDGRAQDRLIFGTTYGQLSDDYADEQEALGHGRPDYEWMFELGYRIQITKYAYAQPDIQYVIQPGGTGDISDATVIGMQFGVSL
ncbi:carbohydrate porin [Thiocystis violacea]|uniref:carbohydrate porin n=1 Tax=Thiocystis violacea TaxID=13725 RepID=UPI00190309B2|nr:carbohydrate porin [Thiocystis violacea]MBK1718236.1 carbohydrate porin [Thiocystis violacea]